MIILKLNDTDIFQILTHQVLIDYLTAKGWSETETGYGHGQVIYRSKEPWELVWIPIKQFPDYARMMSDSFATVVEAEGKTNLDMLIEVLAFEAGASKGDVNPELTSLLGRLKETSLTWCNKTEKETSKK